MTAAGGETAFLRFGKFELDVRRQELRRGGVRVPLQPQPFKLLLLLARRSGEIVSRDEIRRELWGDATFVDVGQGVAFCVRQVRAALGDPARSPVYLETLPRRGYRFVAPVVAVAPVPAQRRPRSLLALLSLLWQALGLSTRPDELP